MKNLWSRTRDVVIFRQILESFIPILCAFYIFVHQFCKNAIINILDDK